MHVSALLMAAGRGARFGVDLPKQYLPLLSRPVLRHAAEALLRDGLVDRVLPVCAAGEEARVSALLDGLPVLPPVVGAETRQGSVRAGLEALAAAPPTPDAVLVHDAARPVVPAGAVLKLVAALGTFPGAIPALRVTDTLKRGEAG